VVASRPRLSYVPPEWLAKLSAGGRLGSTQVRALIFLR